MISASNIRNKLVLKPSELRLTYVVGAFLTVIALIVMTQNYFKYSSLGDYSMGLSLAYNLIVYTTYAALTPVIFYLAKRIPMTEEHWKKRLPLHLGLSVLLGLSHMLFCNVVLYSVDLSSSIIFPRFMSKYLTNVIHFHLLVYWSILLFSTFRNKSDSGDLPVKGEKELLNRFVVGKNGRTYFVEFSEVFWIEAMDHYQKVHTKDGYHVLSDSMRGLESKLPTDQFIRIHRSYFVNAQMIESLTKGSKTTVQLKNGQELNVGVSYQKRLSARFN